MHACKRDCAVENGLWQKVLITWKIKARAKINVGLLEQFQLELKQESETRKYKKKQPNSGLRIRSKLNKLHVSSY